MHAWRISQDAQGGQIAYEGAPRFTARWTTGDLEAAPEALQGACWSDLDGASSDDAIHLYGFTWPDGLPAQAVFEALMRQAVCAIDAWIAERL